MSRRRRKQEIEKGNIVFKILGIINLLFALIFIMYIFSLNILPNKYFAILAIGVILITAVITLGIIKKRKNNILNIISIIIACIILCIYGYVYDYSKKGFDFVDVISEDVKEQFEEYHVITLKANSYENLSNLKSKTIFKFKNTLDSFEVLNEIKKQGEFKFSDYSNLHLLKDELMSKKIESILISDSEYIMLIEEDEKFKNATMKLFTGKHKINVSDNLIDKNDEYVINKGKFNVYVSGIDTSGNINNVSRTDANILLTINTDTREILMTSIPRDYYVTLHSKHAKDKLTHSGVYGINETIKTVEDLLDTDINYYVRINFTSVVKIIDAIGGINVYSDFSFNTPEHSFKKGMNYLNGRKALAFCRERYSFASGDNQRVKNQQKVVEAIINKLTSSTALLTKYTNILNSLSRSFKTNVGKEDISFLVKNQLDDMAGWKITSNALTGRGAREATFSAGSQKLYVMIPNEDSVSDAKNKINLVLKK